MYLFVDRGMERVIFVPINPPLESVLTSTSSSRRTDDDTAKLSQLRPSGSSVSVRFPSEERGESGCLWNQRLFFVRRHHV